MMVISDIDRDVLKCICHRGGLSADEVSKLLPYKHHVVRRSIDKLKSAGIIWKSIICNPFKLGFLLHTMHFSLIPTSPERIAAILERIAQHPSTAWCAAMASSPDYEVTFMAHSPNDLAHFIDQLCDEFGEVFGPKTFAIEVSQHYFGYRAISKRNIPIPEVSLLEGGPTVPIDRVDAQLLKAFSSDAGASLSALSRQLGIPTTTLAYRKKQLLESGVLLQEIYYLNFNAIAPIAYHVMASVANSGKECQQKLLSFSRVNDHIFFCHRCVGDWDFKLGILAQTRLEALATMESIRNIFGNSLTGFRVSAKMQDYKCTMFPFDTALPSNSHPAERGTGRNPLKAGHVT